MSQPARKWTTLIMDAMDNGLLDPNVVADMCLDYMSEADVADMVRANDLKSFLDQSYDDDEDEED